MTAFLAQFAEKRNLYCKVDNAGNVLITLPASLSLENEPPIFVQSHKGGTIDMRYPYRKNLEVNYVLSNGTIAIRNDYFLSMRAGKITKRSKVRENKKLHITASTDLNER